VCRSARLPSVLAHVSEDGRVSALPWTYVWDARRRPFVHPVATPAGHVLTVDAPDDHPWHHALWFTIKFVNGENFWEEYDAYGVLRHPTEPTTSTDGRAITGDLEWIRPDRQTVVLRERRSLTHVPIDDDAYAIDLDTTLTPEVDVVLDRTPFTTWGGYGGLTFRGRADLRRTRLLASDGTEHERVLGDRGAWLDLSGTVDGALAGIAMLDHPDNPNHPVPWYASTRADTYGASPGGGADGDDEADDWSNFVNAAFLWDGPISLAANDTLTFDYRVIVHDGIWDRAQVQEQYDAWAESGFSARG